MKDPGSEHSTHSLNARLLRFRSQPGSEDPSALAEDLIAAKRYGDARSVAVSAQPGDRDDGQLLVLEGRAWFFERDLVRAQAALLRAVRAAPDLAEGYRWLGHVLLKRGDPQRALKTLRRALELDPHDEESQTLAARAEHLSEAAEDGGDAIEQEPPPQAANRRAPAAPPSAAASGRNPRPLAAPQSAGPHNAPVKKGSASGLLASSLFGDGAGASIGTPNEDEPTSSFRRLPGRPDNRAVARGGSGSMPAVKSAIPTPPDDPDLGRYSAQNITAEQFVTPRALQGTRTSGQPNPLKATGRSSAAVMPARPPEPRGRSASDGAHQAVPESPQARSAEPNRSRAPLPRGPLGASEAAAGRRGMSGAPSDVINPRRVSHPVPAADRPLLTATPAPSLPPLPEFASQPPPRREPAPPRRNDAAPAPQSNGSKRRVAASPAPPTAATLETWDEREGVQFDPPSLPLTAAQAPVSPPTDPNQPANAEQAFAVVKGYGLFEEPRGPNAQWALQSDVEPRGTRVRNALIGLWVFTLACSVGGYFGWQAFVEQRHAKAAAWVLEARSLMLRGDHAGLIDAERLLRLAREQHPASTDIPLESLLLQVERVLEDGERDLAGLKSALGRAPVSTDGKAALSVATAVIATFGGDRVTRDKLLDEALSHAPGDARRVHLLGRLEERVGRAQSREHIETASQSDPKLMPARLALASIAFDAGEQADALARVDAVLAEHKEHLRARLMRMFITANDADPAELQAALTGLGDAMKLAGSVDELLKALIEARVLRRQNKIDDAANAIERAAALGVDEPRLLSWVAREALAVNKPVLAQQAAGRALSVAPDVARYRRLLASVLIERGDGARAKELLDKLPAEDLDAQIMKAQAALLEDNDAAMRDALAALAQAPSDKIESAIRVGSLKVRLESKLTPGKPVVDRAKALVKSAPGDPEALLALAEAGLAAHDPATASGALKQRFAVAPDDPNAHYLLGRARRMAADAEGAEASFRKALTLSPGQSDALIALGGLLLDQGKYEEADAVFQELSSRGGSAMQGRLGRVEALIGLGRTSDAQVQLDAIPEAQHTSAAVRSAAARVALARAKPGEALSLLRPLLETQSDRPGLLALYGDALLAAEQLEGAAGSYDKALAIDSSFPEALLGRAQVLLRSNRAKDALPVLDAVKRALSDRIRPPALHALRATLVGQAYVSRNKRGDLDAAKQVLREAVKLPGAPPDASFWLGEALGAKGGPEARAAYQRYLELAPNGKYAERARRASSSLQ